MATILNIDTATEIATVSISSDESVLYSIDNHHQKEHGSFLQPAVKELIKATGLSFKDINAVAVSAGPGSYTGLRVGMASAKGFCYALNIPLIVIGTLDIMAFSAIINYKSEDVADLYCPLIDARRMEVFTCLYDNNLLKIIEPCAMILNEDSFKNYLNNHRILFFGSGSKKLNIYLKDSNTIIKNINIIPEAMAKLSHKKFNEKMFADILYAEPLYVKDFFSYQKPM